MGIANAHFIVRTKQITVTIIIKRDFLKIVCSKRVKKESKIIIPMFTFAPRKSI